MKNRYISLSLIGLMLIIAAVLITENYRIYHGKQFKIQSGDLGQQQTYRYPGEFEKQQAIWLQWPSNIYNENNRPVNPVMVNLVKTLSSFIRVNLITASKQEITAIKTLLNDEGLDSKNLYFFPINHFSIWARDVGPIFVKDSQNKLHIVNFGFNNYSRNGSQYYINVEGQVDKNVAETLGLPVISTNLISEGGAIESNGKGTLMTTESVILKRNPDMSKVKIENEYSRILGVSKIVWLKYGLAEDDEITSGHINEVARFAGPNTILLAQVLPEEKNINLTARTSYQRMEENFRILQSSTDQDDRPFKIIRIPMPPGFYQEAESYGAIPVRSYLNYVVTNGAVIIQTYWQPGRSERLKEVEEQVKSIFQKVFPNRKIIGIDAENVNLWGGGLHCITQHMPASNQ